MVFSLHGFGLVNQTVPANDGTRGAAGHRTAYDDPGHETATVGMVEFYRENAALMKRPRRNERNGKTFADATNDSRSKTMEQDSSKGKGAGQ